MNASEAFKITQKNWSDNEDENLKYVIGYQDKIQKAAENGQTGCMVCNIPSQKAGLMDFTASFFEQQGYYVSFHQSPIPGEISVLINWKQEPLGSRPWIESKEINKFL